MLSFGRGSDPEQSSTRFCTSHAPRNQKGLGFLGFAVFRSVCWPTIQAHAEKIGFAVFIRFTGLRGIMGLVGPIGFVVSRATCV